MAAGLVSRSLYYALGGGLGHLTRARAALAALGESSRVLCASPHAGRFRDLDLLPVPPAARSPAAFRPWLENLLQALRPRDLYLDSFPAGLFGELCGLRLPRGLRLHCLARRLDWTAYRRRLDGAPPPLERVWLLEPLADEHLAWLREHAAGMAPLALHYPADKQPDHPALLPCLAELAPPRWLVVHSGPAEEIRELLGYARDMAAAEGVAPRLVLIAPAPAQCPQGVLHLPLFPARSAFPLAQRIVTACGFNLMQETAPYRDRHRFLPLPRALDDQYARARLARASPWAGGRAAGAE